MKAKHNFFLRHLHEGLQIEMNNVSLYSMPIQNAAIDA